MFTALCSIFKNRIKITNNIAILLLVFSPVFSCNNFSLNNVKTDHSYSIESNNENHSLVFNVDENNNNGEAFSVNLNFNDFSLKSSTSGQVKKTKSDISLIRIYLVDTNSSILDESNIKFGPLDLTSNNTGSLLTFFNNVKDSAGTGSIIFKNVGQGTYYVAISAYNATSGLDYTKNITTTSNNTSGAYTTITTTSSNLGRFALSTSGGDSNSGSVQIERLVTGSVINYILTNGGTSPLNVNLALKSGIGANIDATTTITEGSSSIPATTLQ